MGFEKEGSLKEYVCRQCILFLDINDLEDGKCPVCGQDETVF